MRIGGSEDRRIGGGRKRSRRTELSEIQRERGFELLNDFPVFLLIIIFVVIEIIKRGRREKTPGTILWEVDGSTLSKRFWCNIFSLFRLADIFPKTFVDRKPPRCD